MKKQILSITAAAALCAGALAGCGTAAETEALSDKLEEVTRLYNGYAEVVAENGTDEQKDGLAKAKDELDEITAEFNGGKLDKKAILALIEDLGEIADDIKEHGDAAASNDGADAAPDNSVLEDKLAEAAALVNGVAENVAQNGSEYQKQLISEYQNEIKGYADELAKELPEGRAAEIDFAADVIKAIATAVNERVNSGEKPSEVDIDALGDEAEQAAALVSGIAERALTGENPEQRFYAARLTDEVKKVGDRLSADEISLDEARNIADEIAAIKAMAEKF